MSQREDLSQESPDDELPLETRRSMLKTVIAWCMMAGNLGQLAERIASMEFFSPATDSASAWEIVNRLLSDYPRFRTASPEEARHFLETFLGFCGRNVDVNELAAWLQPLRESLL